MIKVVVNGTFDIVHTGHLRMLNYAKTIGDYVLVCIDTDRRTQELKGPNRPINTQEERKFLLECLRSVDEVQLFDSDEELLEIFKIYQPDIMVKGSDYIGTNYLGHQYCKSTKWFDRIDEYSSTKKIQDIARRR